MTANDGDAAVDADDSIVVCCIGGGGGGIVERLVARLDAAAAVDRQ